MDTDPPKDPAANLVPTVASICEHLPPEWRETFRAELDEAVDALDLLRIDHVVTVWHAQARMFADPTIQAAFDSIDLGEAEWFPSPFKDRRRPLILFTVSDLRRYLPAEQVAPFDEQLAALNLADGGAVAAFREEFWVRAAYATDPEDPDLRSALDRIVAKLPPWPRPQAPGAAGTSEE